MFDFDLFDFVVSQIVGSVEDEENASYDHLDAIGEAAVARAADAALAGRDYEAYEDLDQLSLAW